MKRILCSLLFSLNLIQGILFCCLVFMFANSTFAEEMEPKKLYSPEAIKIMRNIKCPICDGQSIYDTNNDISQKMRSLVVKLSLDGKNKIEIEKIFVKNFGPGIIIDNSITYVYAMYIVPLLILKILFALLFFKIFRHSRKKLQPL